MKYRMKFKQYKIKCRKHRLIKQLKSYKSSLNDFERLNENQIDDSDNVKKGAISFKLLFEKNINNIKHKIIKLKNQLYDQKKTSNTEDCKRCKLDDICDRYTLYR